MDNRINVIKLKNEYGCYDIVLEENNKQLKMFFCGNLDLYWSIYDFNKDSNENIFEFMITKNNYLIYELFDELFNRVKNCKIMDVDDTRIYMCQSIEELKDYLEEVKKYNEYVLMCEENNPERLFKNNMIEWHCDDAPYEDAHVLKIKRQDEDSYLVRIELNKNELYNRHSIRFRNARSGHTPFNNLFMDMFNKLQDYNIDNKQIHIEEYMYQKKLEKRVK